MRMTRRKRRSGKQFVTLRSSTDKNTGLLTREMGVQIFSEGLNIKGV